MKDFFKRFAWFIGVNIAFNLTIVLLVLALMALFPNATAVFLSKLGHNGNIGSIFIYSCIVGFIAAFFSLLISKWTAKLFMGVKTITLEKNPEYQDLINIVEKLSKQLNIKVPEIGIFDSTFMNAFATGRSKNSALVAFSTSLLNKMSKDGLEAVVAHELCHIKNGDMVLMTLIQGIVNTFVLTISHVVSNLVEKVTDSGILSMITYIGLQIILGFAALPITAFFSRLREFKADQDAADLVGSHKMVIALQELQSDSVNLSDSKVNEAMSITSKKSKFSWLDTHPTFEQRIYALNSNN